MSSTTSSNPTPGPIAGVNDVTPERTLLLWTIENPVWQGKHTVRELGLQGTGLRTVVSIVPPDFAQRISSIQHRVAALRETYTYVWDGQSRVGTVQTYRMIIDEAASIRTACRAIMVDLVETVGLGRLLDEAGTRWTDVLTTAERENGTPEEEIGRRVEKGVAAIMARYPQNDDAMAAKFGGWDACGVRLKPRTIRGVPEILREHVDTEIGQRILREAEADFEQRLDSLTKGAREALSDVIRRTSRQVMEGQKLSDATFNDLNNALLLMRNFGAHGTDRTLEEVNSAIERVERITAAAARAREASSQETTITDAVRAEATASGFTAACASLVRVLEDRTEVEAARAQIGHRPQRRLAID